MLYITVGVLAFIGLVLVGEYLVVMYSQSKTGEVVGTEPEVIAIRKQAKRGVAVPVLSQRYGVRTFTIYNIINRKTWQIREG